MITELVGAHRRAKTTAGDSFAVVVTPDSTAARVTGLVALDSLIPTYSTVNGAVNGDEAS